MVKLRNFWVALAMGCAISLGTASCSDDDDDKDRQEQTDVDGAKKSGNFMKEIVENYEKYGSNLVDQATEMTKSKLQELALIILDYNKNKDNEEWKNSFNSEAGSPEAAAMLDDVIKKLEGDEVGVVLSEISADELVETFKEFFKPVDELGSGEADGKAESEAYKATIVSVYNEKLSAIPADDEHLGDMLDMFKELPDTQKKEFANVSISWANKSDDAAWQKGFLAGTGLSSADQANLREKLDYLAQYKTNLMAFAM